MIDAETWWRRATRFERRISRNTSVKNGNPSAVGLRRPGGRATPHTRAAVGHPTGKQRFRSALRVSPHSNAPLRLSSGSQRKAPPGRDTGSGPSGPLLGAPPQCFDLSPGSRASRPSPQLRLLRLVPAGLPVSTCVETPAVLRDTTKLPGEVLHLAHGFTALRSVDDAGRLHLRLDHISRTSGPPSLCARGETCGSQGANNLY